MMAYERHIASIESIPPEMRDLPIWCAWQLVYKAGKPKPDKTPVSPITGQGSGWNQAGFCTTAQRAIDFAESRQNLHGIGLVLFPEFGIAGGDLDQCRDVETGEPSQLAAQLLASANTYTEISPSLAGFRFLFFGSFGGHTGNNRDLGVELYEEKRFLTFTGQQVEGSPFALEDRDLTVMGKRFFDKASSKPASNFAVGDFSSVDIQALNLKPWTVEAITTGGKNPDRSAEIWGVMRDMATAGCDDLTICRVLADPRNGIAQKALENRNGNIASAMRWVASQLPKVRDSLNLPTESGDSFSLEQFSMVGDIEQLETKLQTDIFVMGRLALLGQATVIYAQPNAGKTLITLKLLIEAIQAGTIEPKSVFYINADDHYRGLITKAKLASKHGFHMLAPDHHGFDPAKFQTYVDQLVIQDKARGNIIVLDTLKKFADTMDKRRSSEFNKTIRRFVLAGGTVIALAHVNKHKGTDGKAVHAGTSDTLDDFDAAYVVEVVKRTDDEVVVCFENRKSRGDNDSQASYKYRGKGAVSNYFELIASVQPVDAVTVEHSREVEAATRNRKLQETAIIALIQAMAQGYKTQTEIIKQAAQHCEHGTKKLKAILNQHAGDDFLSGHCWKLTINDKNAHLYEPLPLALQLYSGA